MPILRRGKGNRTINKSDAKQIEDGRIVSDLPLVPFKGRRVRLFQVESPHSCPRDGGKLRVNKHYNRFILTNYGPIRVPVISWECVICGEFYPDQIVGVTGSNNYSEELLEKEYYTRNNGKSSLWNTSTIGKIWIQGAEPRAPCPTTLWKYDQLKGEIALEELRDEKIEFNGTLHIDGYYIKVGWKKFLEEQMGRELNKREWKRIRNKVIWVVSTEDKVILDFDITDRHPDHLQLIPLLARIKDRLGEERIKRVISDEEGAIIDAVKVVLPKASHGFCVFHQLKKLTEIYLDKYGCIDKIPEQDREFYELCRELILAEDAINSSIAFKELRDWFKSNDLSHQSYKAMKYIRNVYVKNRKILEEGWAPETNNTMEQLFSFINDFAIQSRSFKTRSGLKNWASNLFFLMNHRPFNTGLNRGLSPLQISDSHG